MEVLDHPGHQVLLRILEIFRRPAAMEEPEELPAIEEMMVPQEAAAMQILQARQS